jgi:hypothetical protein
MSANRATEIASNHAADPHRILHRDRTVQTQLMAQGCPYLQCRLLAEHDQHRVPGKHSDEHEDDYAHEEQDRQHTNEAITNIS